jgi:(1->4)-alpha-D-glucan 1-alpha-D-glucosylmutase
MGLLALESQRQKCLIIGEDLGTVPDEVRSAMNTFGILSYRLFYFERGHDDEFMLPEHYPANSLAAIATHDLPTLRGFWTGADLAIREKLALYPDEEVKAHQQVVRQLDRERLLRALERTGLLNAEISAHGTSPHEIHPLLAHAIHVYLGRSRAKLLTIQPEDIFGQIDQINVPSSTDQYPNWRYKVALNLEDWCTDPRLQALADALREMRSGHKR